MLTIMETALILGVKVSYVKKIAEQGDLNSTVSDKGLILFTMDEITSYIKKQDIDSDIKPLFPMNDDTEINVCYHIVKGEFAQLINYSYLQSLLFNRLRVFQVLKGLSAMKRSLFDIYDELVVPILDRNLEFYKQGKVTVMEMQLVKHVIIDSIIRLQGLMVIDDDYVGTVYCATLSKDYIDPLLKMMDHVLELRGFRVINCGTLEPTTNVEKIFDDFCCPQRIYISVPRDYDDNDVCKTLKNLMTIVSKYNAKIFLLTQGRKSCMRDVDGVITIVQTFSDIANS